MPSHGLLGMRTHGVILYEPFGGLAAGLEMLLYAGVPVRQYIYSDTSRSAAAVAAHRCELLSRTFGTELFPPTAYEQAFSLLPADVYSVTAAHLEAAVAAFPGQWALVAGWECQDFSAAGSRQGLEGKRSSSFFPLVRILDALQRLMPDQPPAYVLENTSMQFTVSADYPRICAAIGLPVTVDAARLGSGAHRLRNYWTNLADTRQLQMVFDLVERPPRMGVRLDPGRQTQICVNARTPPFYSVNTPGERILVLPTLVSYYRSHAFRDGNAGMVIAADGRLTDLTIAERERCLGYEAGCTAAPGVSYMQRHEVTGACMDGNVMRALWFTSLALRLDHAACEATAHPPEPSSQEPPARPSGGDDRPQQLHALLATIARDNFWETTEGQTGQLFLELFSLSAAAERADAALAPRPSPAAPLADTDVWQDPLCLHHIRHGEFSQEQVDSSTPAERLRAFRRAQSYTMRRGRVHRIIAPGQLREVPPPSERADLVLSLHKQMGHYGRRRTTYLLMLTYWWAGLYRAVRDCLRACVTCNQTKATFNHVQPVLHSLPIKGPFYRWHLDLAGPFTMSTHGMRYAFIAIEAFWKVAVIGAIPAKAARDTTCFFLHRVLGQYGTCAEVVTDQGTEWLGDFQDMLTDCFIDHRVTSPNHPQANGQAERAVQMIKSCLQRYQELASPAQAVDGSSTWDDRLPFIMLGYNSSPHAATKFSPYELLHGFAPTVPPATRERFAEPFDFDDPMAAAASLAERAELAERRLITVGQNLLIAQHQNTQRYARVRSGGYLPKTRHFRAGDYVFVKHTTQGNRHINSLTPLARDEILRVVEVRASGVLVLAGACGSTVTENAVNCTLCHLAIDEASAAPAVRVQPGHASQCCEVCRLPHDEAIMVLCDACDRGYHIYCLEPPLARVPRPTEVWLCPSCQEAGVDPLTLQTRQAAAPNKPMPRRASPARKVAFAAAPATGATPLAAPATRPPIGATRSSARLRGATAAVTVGDVPSAPPRAPPAQYAYTPLGLQEALAGLMPGPRDDAQLEGILRGCPTRTGLPPYTQGPALTAEDVGDLCAAVDFSHCARIADTFGSDASAVVSTFARHQLPVLSNSLAAADSAVTHLDALQPYTYYRLAQGGPLQAVVEKVRRFASVQRAPSAPHEPTCSLHSSPRWHAPSEVGI
jgi:hypothetical protein